jgi:hypothetical protein
MKKKSNLALPHLVSEMWPHRHKLAGANSIPYSAGKIMFIGKRIRSLHGFPIKCQEFYNWQKRCFWARRVKISLPLPNSMFTGKPHTP